MPAVPNVTAGQIITEAWGDAVADEVNLLRPYNILNARGQIIRRGAAAPEALNLGASGRFLKSDGNDPVWGTVDFSDLTNYALPGYTPGIAFGGNAVGLTYAFQVGRAKRLGATGLMLLTFGIQLSALGSSTGAATITGLPITIENSNAAGGGVIYEYSGLVGITSGSVTARSVGGSTNSNIYQGGTTATVALTHANFSATSLIRGQLVVQLP